MMPRVVLAAAALACLVVSRGTGSAAQRATPTLDALARKMAPLRDYSVTIDAHEVDGASSDDRIMRFWYLKPDHAKLEVLRGAAAGTRLIWNGGTKVHVRGGIFSWLPLRLDLHDPRITSVRGNTMLRAEFQPALDCFVAHRGAVRESAGPPIEGDETVLLTLAIPAGLGCAGDSAKDSAVTRDVLTVTRRTAFVRRRERYVGDTLVERWSLRDLKLDSGLTDADFR